MEHFTNSIDPSKTDKLDNSDFAGFDMNGAPIRNVDTFDKCFDLCAQNNICQWVTYNKDNKECYLKKGVNASVSTLLGKGFTYNTSDLGGFDIPNKTFDNIPNAAACKEKCLADTECKAAVYNKDTSKCFLKKPEAKPCCVHQFKTTEGLPTIDYSKTEKIDGYDFGGTQFDMNGMPITNVESADKCAKLCQDNNICQWSTYVKDKKECWLKKGINIQDGTLVGKGFTYHMTDLNGYDISGKIYSDIADVETCRTKCTSDTECKAAVYNSASKQCILKKPEPNSNLVCQFKSTTKKETPPSPRDYKTLAKTDYSAASTTGTKDGTVDECKQECDKNSATCIGFTTDGKKCTFKNSSAKVPIYKEGVTFYYTGNAPSAAAAADNSLLYAGGGGLSLLSSISSSCCCFLIIILLAFLLLNR